MSPPRRKLRYLIGMSCLLAQPLVGLLVLMGCQGASLVQQTFMDALDWAMPGFQPRFTTYHTSRGLVVMMHGFMGSASAFCPSIRCAGRRGRLFTRRVHQCQRQRGCMSHAHPSPSAGVYGY